MRCWELIAEVPHCIDKCLGIPKTSCCSQLMMHSLTWLSSQEHSNALLHCQLYLPIYLETDSIKMNQPQSIIGNYPMVQIQVNLCQKLLFLHQPTHNTTTDCSLNYKFNKWKFQAQTWGEHIVYRNCFSYSEQFLYTTCSPHVLQKEEFLTKIYL